MVVVSVNEQLSPREGAPGVLEALRRAEGRAVCAALANWQANRWADKRSRGCHAPAPLFTRAHGRRGFSEVHGALKVRIGPVR